MYDVTAIGELLIDFACTGSDSYGYPAMAAHPGGAPANFLAALQKFGAHTAFISKVGNDAFGKLLTGTVTEAGIDASGVITCDDTFTTLAFVTFNQDGDREFSFARKPGADTKITFEELDLSLIEKSKIFHFGTLSLTDEPAKTAVKKAVAYARSLDKLITFDPNLRKPLWKSLDEAKEQILWGLKQADVVKISDEEVEFIFGDIPFEAAAEKLLHDFNISLVFITLGKNGCLFANKNAMGRVPGLQGLNTIDTTGAGDIFGGSAVWKFLKTGKKADELSENELREITQFACASAGLSTTKPGGISSIPELDEVNAKVKEAYK